MNDTLILYILIGITFVVSYFGLSNSVFFERYQFQVGAIRYNKQYRRLLSSMFLHASWGHLFFNMLALYFFAPIIIRLFGAGLFLVLYFLSGLAGSVLSLWLYKNRPSYAMIGASGAVSGVIFASIALQPFNSMIIFPIPVPITAWIYATLYFAYSVWSLLNPRPNDYVGHAAHLGGAAFGMLFIGVLVPLVFVVHGVYIGIMSLPLLYLAFELLVNKKRR
ncbi:rhomboid family intramembrane serine protease [Kingella negevensis]|uniref:rhomboid family intramembrane serine protease n=1 Tax=Kingella negevensis TaxID=1522312 RepID=UPI00050A322A|nr:rhomboid family intramembrane serine protease [Kingella negevensis]MDK4688981.1 rhomboid family intramembrane serine protease [Kingella negevensis]WII90569.1 rhomboid family intramembrane serine protease [Kingella negevensis]